MTAPSRDSNNSKTAPPAAVSGAAFFDLNSNGTQDTGEGVAEGVGVTLTPGSGSPQTIYTDQNGNYSFPASSPSARPTWRSRPAYDENAIWLNR